MGLKKIYIDDHDGADWIKRVSRRSVAASANADHSDSSIVCWTPSIREADDLCLPDGETSDHLHCTLVYLGQSEAVPDSVQDIVAAIADRFSPFVAHVQGTAIFNTPDGDVLVRLLDAPELEQIQQRLHDEIAAVMDVPDTHGFTAHITLKYLAPDEEIDPSWFKLPQMDVAINSITTDFGVKRTDYPLATEVILTKAEFGDVAGHDFHGNQYVQVAGGDNVDDVLKEVRGNVPEFGYSPSKGEITKHGGILKAGKTYGDGGKVIAEWEDAKPIGQRELFGKTYDIYEPTIITQDRSHGESFPTKSAEPVEHLFRSVSEEDWQRMQAQGYLDTNGSHNIEYLDKGAQLMNADYEPSTSYLPYPESSPGVPSSYGTGDGRILRIDYKKEDGWFAAPDIDGYIRTDQPVPIDRVSMVSPIIRADEKYRRTVVSSAEFGEGPGHPFRGNQWTDGSGSEEALRDDIMTWSNQFPKNTVFRAMHRDDLARVQRSGQLDSAFDSHRAVYGSKNPTDVVNYLDRNEVVIAYHVDPSERQGAGPSPYTKTLPLPADRILGIFDPLEAAPDSIQSIYRGDLGLLQPLELGEDTGHAFRGNQYTGGIGGEKGEWESTSGSPRLAPLEKRDGKNKGAALPIEMITMRQLPPDIRAKVMDRVRDRVASTQKINASFDHFMATAWNNPELKEAGMTWYQKTHDLTMEIADQHDLEPQNVAAAFAAMSPGKVWSEEAGIIEGMADMDQGNVHLSDEKLDLVNQKMDAYGFDRIENGDSYADMESRQAVITMQSQFMEEGRGSWGVGYGYGNFAKGLDLLRGANVDDTLPGPKVRSFTNNIMDPSDPRDVTIDIHMVQGAARDPAVVNDSGVMSSPSYQGASIGIYPYIADVTRRVADDYGVLPQQAQALIWLGYKSELGQSAYTGINE